METWTIPLSLRATPMALQYRKPPLMCLTLCAMALAISRSSVFKLTLKATNGILAPTAVTPAVGWISFGPKSGFHRGSFNFSAIPSNCPFLIAARFCLSILVADFSYKNTGSPYFLDTSFATSFEKSTASVILTFLIGINGTTSMAPILGCCPSCFLMSIRSTATPIASITACFMATGSPNAVTTSLLWSSSLW